MTIRLSVALLTHDEREELTWLLDALAPLRTRDDFEIVVIDDFSQESMLDLLRERGINFQQRQLSNDFAAQRNFAKQACRGDYVLFLDPDEIPSDRLLSSLFPLCSRMEEAGVDACAFPRLNVILDGERPTHHRELALSDDGFEGVDPDYQLRLCRNKATIAWKHTVHEKLSGVKRCFRLAARLDNALIHAKTAKRQSGQNTLYGTIDVFSIRNLAKRLRLRRLAAWLGFVEEPAWVPFDLGELWNGKAAAAGRGA